MLDDQGDDKTFKFLRLCQVFITSTRLIDDTDKQIERMTTTDLEGGITREQIVKGKLNLVDLAGSEKADKTGATGTSSVTLITSIIQSSWDVRKSRVVCQSEVSVNCGLHEIIDHAL
jgi:hypothetical protein